MTSNYQAGEEFVNRIRNIIRENENIRSRTSTHQPSTELLNRLKRDVPDLKNDAARTYPWNPSGLKSARERLDRNQHRRSQMCEQHDYQSLKDRYYSDINTIERDLSYIDTDLAAKKWLHDIFGPVSTKVIVAGVEHLPNYLNNPPQ